MHDQVTKFFPTPWSKKKKEVSTRHHYHVLIEVSEFKVIMGMDKGSTQFNSRYCVFTVVCNSYSTGPGIYSSK